MSHASCTDRRAWWRRVAERPGVAGARRRRVRPDLEDLEGRELLSSVTEYPIPSKSGSAYQIITGPDKNLWFTENDPVSNRIGQVTTAGQITEHSVPTFGGMPNGITVGPGNALWFTEQFGDKIGQVSTSGQFAEYPTKSTQQLAGITEGPDGNLWYAVSLGHAIGVLNASTHAATQYPLTNLASPKNIVTGPDNNLWFTDPGTNSVGMITTSGTSTEYSLKNVSIVADPEGIVSNPVTKSLWITEDFYGYIGEISTSGAVLNEYKVPGTNTSPSGITVDGSGNIWFIENGLGTNRIGELNPSTGQFTMYDLPTGAKGDGITVGPDGNIWFTDRGNKSIGVLNINGSGGPAPSPSPSPSPIPSPSPSPSPTPSPASNPGSPPTSPTLVSTPIAPGVAVLTAGTFATNQTPRPAASPISLSHGHKHRRRHRPTRAPGRHHPHQSATAIRSSINVVPSLTTARQGLGSPGESGASMPD